MNWIIKSILILLSLFIIDRIGLWAEKRGYVYWRKKKPSSGGFGNALGELQSFMRPSAKYVIEVQEKKDVKERGEQGDGMIPTKKDGADV